MIHKQWCQGYSQNRFQMWKSHMGFQLVLKILSRNISAHFLYLSDQGDQILFNLCRKNLLYQFYKLQRILFLLLQWQIHWWHHPLLRILMQSTLNKKDITYELDQATLKLLILFGMEFQVAYQSDVHIWHCSLIGRKVFCNQLELKSCFSCHD